MPVITNKKTKVQYSVSEEELNKILNNPLTAKSFAITRPTIPDEVKALMEQKEKAPVRQKRNQKHTK
ncbi:MAG: hypothetical protein QM802_19930 [Agriterribacter sp.]